MPRKQLINGEWVKVCCRADCHKAGIPQPIEGFSKNKSRSDGLEHRCKKCMKARGAAYYANNRERILARKAEYHARPEIKAQKAEYYARPDVKARKKAYNKTYYSRPENRDRQKAYGKTYRSENKEQIKAFKKAYHARPENKARKNQRRRERYHSDPKYRLKQCVSTNIREALKLRGKTKGGRTFDHLPYTPKELMEHIEKQFDKNMTWENQGSYWHLDHIKPHASYKYDSLTDPEFQECWALENLRPLKASENMSKGSFYEGRRYYHNEST